MRGPRDTLARESSRDSPVRESLQFSSLLQVRSKEQAVPAMSARAPRASRMEECHADLLDLCVPKTSSVLIA
jgi:hypothetical protein